MTSGAVARENDGKKRSLERGRHNRELHDIAKGTEEEGREGRWDWARVRTSK